MDLVRSHLGHVDGKLYCTLLCKEDPMLIHCPRYFIFCKCQSDENKSGSIVQNFHTSCKCIIYRGVCIRQGMHFKVKQNSVIVDKCEIVEKMTCHLTRLRCYCSTEKPVAGRYRIGFIFPRRAVSN